MAQLDTIKRRLSSKEKEVVKAIEKTAFVPYYHSNVRTVKKRLYYSSIIIFEIAVGALLLLFGAFTNISLNYYVSSLPQEKKVVYYTVDLPEGVQSVATLENKYKFLPRATPAQKEEMVETVRESQIAAVIASQVTDRVKRGSATQIYQEAGDFFMIPWQILAAVHFVETRQSGDTTRTSYAGATGPMQFIPSTFAAYAVDGDGDGTASIYDLHDAIFTAAKYLAANGADRGNVRGALFRYNHSYSYVNRVLAIARSMGYKK